MKDYTTFEEITNDLKRLELQRNIYWEELKLSKNKMTEDLKFTSWIASLSKNIAKYGLFYLVRKFFK